MADRRNIVSYNNGTGKFMPLGDVARPGTKYNDLTIMHNTLAVVITDLNGAPPRSPCTIVCKALEASLVVGVIVLFSSAYC